MSITTRLSTAGEATIAISAIGLATGSGTSEPVQHPVTRRSRSASASSRLCTSTIGLWRNQRSGRRPPASNSTIATPSSSRNRLMPCSGQIAPSKPAKPTTRADHRIADHLGQAHVALHQVAGGRGGGQQQRPQHGGQAGRGPHPLGPEAQQIVGRKDVIDQADAGHQARRRSWCEEKACQCSTREAGMPPASASSTNMGIGTSKRSPSLGHEEEAARAWYRWAPAAGSRWCSGRTRPAPAAAAGRSRRGP